ncbi:MAG TPA: hypothetical protein PKE12_08005 [Kiritimatiellia bacterium]|nr:hypothetical protein [Kiritimatiellia bacterium]
MKSIVLIYENAADLPRKELDGRTPLEVARCPAATRLVLEGLGGSFAKASARAPGSAESRLAALCGVPEASAALAARGPLEAASLGIELADYSDAYCGELVTLDDGRVRDGRLARLTLQETEALAHAVQKLFDPARVRLLPRAPGRLAVLVRADGEDLAPGQAPWLLEGEEIDLLPRRGAELMGEMLEKSAQALARQTINDVRVDLGENPASAIWLWGGGPLARLGAPSLRTMVWTQSAMAAGLARQLGLPVQPLLDPWTAAQPSDVVDAGAVREWLGAVDRLVVYVEAPPEFLRESAREKVRLLERMDVLLTQPLLDVFKRVKERRFLLASVEAAVSEDAARRAPQVLALWGSHMEADGVEHWHETACREGRLAGVSMDDVVNRLMGD